jgi:hypothetical protein
MIKTHSFLYYTFAALNILINFSFRTLMPYIHVAKYTVAFINSAGVLCLMLITYPFLQHNFWHRIRLYKKTIVLNNVWSAGFLAMLLFSVKFFSVNDGSFLFYIFNMLMAYFTVLHIPRLRLECILLCAVTLLYLGYYSTTHTIQQTLYVFIYQFFTLLFGYLSTLEMDKQTQHFSIPEISFSRFWLLGTANIWFAIQQPWSVIHSISLYDAVQLLLYSVLFTVLPVLAYVAGLRFSPTPLHLLRLYSIGMLSVLAVYEFWQKTISFDTHLSTLCGVIFLVIGFLYRKSSH